MLAYCPYCKEKVTVRSDLHVAEAMRLLAENKRILVRHGGLLQVNTWESSFE
jgi:hypothetical protein